MTITMNGVAKMTLEAIVAEVEQEVLTYVRCWTPYEEEALTQTCHYRIATVIETIDTTETDRATDIENMTAIAQGDEIDLSGDVLVIEMSRGLGGEAVTEMVDPIGMIHARELEEGKKMTVEKDRTSRLPMA